MQEAKYLHHSRQMGCILFQQVRILMSTSGIILARMGLWLRRRRANGLASVSSQTMWQWLYPGVGWLLWIVAPQLSLENPHPPLTQGRVVKKVCCCNLSWLRVHNGNCHSLPLKIYHSATDFSLTLCPRVLQHGQRKIFLQAHWLYHLQCANRSTSSWRCHARACMAPLMHGVWWL